MITRSKLKLGEGELVETNPEIGRVYPRRKMAEENPLESDSQFMDSFMTMRAMVEEMYREFKKGRSEDSSTSKQDKGTEESLLDGHSESKGKGKKAPLSTDFWSTSTQAKPFQSSPGKPVRELFKFMYLSSSGKIHLQTKQNNKRQLISSTKNSLKTVPALPPFPCSLEAANMYYTDMDCIVWIP